MPNIAHILLSLSLSLSLSTVLSQASNLNPKPCTRPGLKPVPCTLHPAPCTLNSTPYIGHSQCPPLPNEYDTHKTDTARFWPLLSGESAETFLGLPSSLGWGVALPPLSGSYCQSTFDAVYVYVVPWWELPIVPSYPYYPHTVSGTSPSMNAGTSPSMNTHCQRHFPLYERHLKMCG